MGDGEWMMGLSGVASAGDARINYAVSIHTCPP